MFNNKKAAGAALALAGALTLTACAAEEPANEATGTETNAATANMTLVTDGALTVCTNAPFAPFEYEDESGDLVGIDMDLTKLAAEDLGLEFKPVQYDFDAMSSGAAFAAGACDVIATGMTITEERQQKFLFSDPYYDANQAVLMPYGSSISSLADLKDKKIAVQVETTGLTVAKDAGLSIVEFPEVGSVVNAVLSGQADAAIADVGVLASYANDELTVAYTEETNEQYGFGVAQTNQALADALSAAVSDAKASGEYNKIIEAHVTAGN